MDKERASVVFLITALALPYVTILKWGFTGINNGIRDITYFFLSAIILFVVGAFLSRYDKPLGSFIVFSSVMTLYWHSSSALSTLYWMTLGSIFLVLLREIPRDYLPIAKYVLIGSGCIQVFYAYVQMFEYDPLFFGFRKVDVYFVHGTLEHHNFLGAFLAMIIPLAPIIILPILFMGLISSASLLSFVAAFGGILYNIKSLKYRVFVTTGAALFIVIFFWNKSRDSFYSRFRIWGEALANFDSSWFTMLFGNGLGSWYLQKFVDAKDPEQVFFQAHNEYLQLLYETGFIGILFLVWWIYHWRKSLNHGCIIAIAISAIGIYNFHIPYLAITAILIIAIAHRSEVTKKLKKEEQCAAGSSQYYV